MERLQAGDQVVVTSGAHKGSKGRVKKVLKDVERVLVEGVNMVKRHTRPTPQRPGGIVSKEAPLHVSNVSPVDPETGKATRVRFEERDGKKVRVAKSGAVITAQRASRAE